MGPLSCTRYVVDRNVVMGRITILKQRSRGRVFGISTLCRLENQGFIFKFRKEARNFSLAHYSFFLFHSEILLALSMYISYLILRLFFNVAVPMVSVLLLYFHISGKILFFLCLWFRAS